MRTFVLVQCFLIETPFFEEAKTTIYVDPWGVSQGNIIRSTLVGKLVNYEQKIT